MEFLTFQRFNDLILVEQLVEQLKQNEIPFEIEEYNPSFEATLLLQENFISKEVIIKLKKEDFEKANSILSTISEMSIEEMPVDYYLFSFTDEELVGILVKPDEWSALDYQLAQKVLSKRGKKIDDETIKLLKKQRVQELSKPEKFATHWKLTGFLFAVLGGFLGIMIGIYLVSFKKTLSNGETVYVYGVKDRKQGWLMIVIGAIMFTISLWLRFMIP